jgi:hypothetical protein
MPNNYGIFAAQEKREYIMAWANGVNEGRHDTAMRPYATNLHAQNPNMPSHGSVNRWINDQKLWENHADDLARVKRAVKISGAASAVRGAQTVRTKTDAKYLAMEAANNPVGSQSPGYSVPRPYGYRQQPSLPQPQYTQQPSLPQPQYTQQPSLPQQQYTPQYTPASAAPGYGQPASGYGQPQPASGYGQQPSLPQQYTPAASGYGQPASGYGQPQPASGYGQQQYQQAASLEVPNSGRSHNPFSYQSSTLAGWNAVPVNPSNWNAGPVNPPKKSSSSSGQGHGMK